MHCVYLYIVCTYIHMCLFTYSDKNVISIWNNGRGIPVEMHKKEGMYVPSMIFGHLLTSSNYDDKQKKVTGGRNGYGAKLCNIFSTLFTVETANSESGKAFKQVRTSQIILCTYVQYYEVMRSNELHTYVHTYVIWLHTHASGMKLVMVVLAKTNSVIFDVRLGGITCLKPKLRKSSVQRETTQRSHFVQIFRSLG